MFRKVDMKKPFSKIEQSVLKFWEKEKIFEKSVLQRKEKGAKKYVFFDGPPFANGLPHYGHILANALKDAVTRYWTMKGFCVPRVNGWDCHGLPVEYEIEKELNISGKKEIEKIGVAKFNTECRKSVFRYTEAWEKLLKRLARWVDFEHSYATLENEYMESIFWVFKEIWKKKMVYQGYKSMHICPRCETALSNFEVSLGYKEVTDASVIVKFKLLDGKYKGAHILAWTTTPWTLPGNMFLAFHPDVTYVIAESGGGKYIAAKPLIQKVFKDRAYEIKEEFKAKKIENDHYEPLFPFYEHLKKTFRVTLADFVTVEDGTGVVHIAPGFGEDDMNVGKREKVEPIMHVNMDGAFTSEIAPWAGKFAKGQDLNIKDHLEKEGKLFHFENYPHSYPHCWRCDTPLLNYSMKSWFIRVTDIKEKLVQNNKKIHWTPSHIKEGRFGKWLENVRDWNISRNRFWGCPIPIWECGKCGFQTCVGSIKELRENAANGNTYIFVRHGEAENNAAKILNSDAKNVHHLTEKGKKQAIKTAKKLKKEHADMIFASPFARTKETSEIIAKEIGVGIEFDQHLREHEVGEFEGKPEKDFVSAFKTPEERFHKKLNMAESFENVVTRTGNFLDFLDRKYSGKTFVIVTHGNVIRAARYLFDERTKQTVFSDISDFAGIIKIYSGKLPKREGLLDLHKPYIDEIKLKCGKCEGEMARIPEVLDCWFESGAMPYAQLHYPFENKDEFEKNFPAHFIAEGLDQTRGWFYTLHVLSTILFDSPAFKNVIVNGVILAEDGEKLSKRKKNYPDPAKLFEKYGVDSTRVFLYASNASVAGDVRFSEKHVEETVKKFTLTLWNAYGFFMTYAGIDKWSPENKKSAKKPQNKLDQWILSELHALIKAVTKAMNSYNLNLAVRPMINFVDNLSNWYIRRSRRRFWKSENDDDKNEAYETLYEVLTTFAKLLAPFAPYISEEIFKNLTQETSVHLETWPSHDEERIDLSFNKEIALVRKIVALGHNVRASKNIKVRQPLQKLQIALPESVSQEALKEYLPVIQEELNVKETEILLDAGKVAKRIFLPNPRILGPKHGKKVQEILRLCREGKFEIHNEKIKVGDFMMDEEDGTLGFQGKEGFDVASEEGLVVALDTAITEELKNEGFVREIVRNLQEMRKEAGYQVDDRIYIFIETEKPLKDAVNRYADYIKKETLALELQEGGNFEWDRERNLTLDRQNITLAIRK